MSATVSYNGNTIATIASGTKTLKTSHKWMVDDITITESGGATNFVTGTFKGTSTGTMDVTIPYSGTSYPIAVIIVPTEGAYNSTTGTIYSLVQRYVISEWVMTKSRITASPTYATSGGANYGVTAWVYKSSTSSATSYSRSSAMNTNVYTTDSATAAGATACRVLSNKKLNVYIAASSYGFAPNVEYKYMVVYG